MKTLKHTFCFGIMSLLLVFGCDQVKDDDPGPEIFLESLRYAKADDPIVIPVYGDFNGDEVTLTSSNAAAEHLITAGHNGSFLKYEMSGTEVEFIDVEVMKDGRLLGSGQVQVQLVDEDDCVNSSFSDNHVVSQGESLEVDLLANDSFCNFVRPGSAGVRVVDVTDNTDGVLISITTNSAVLTYTPPEGFTGNVQFIYELCYGFDDDRTFEAVLENPINNCSFYYVALTTIEVI